MSEIIVSKKAQKQLKELKSTTHFDGMINFIRELQNNPFPKGYDIAKVKKDKSIRVRFGKYRLFYQINKKENRIEVLAIELRKKAYK